MGAMRMIQKAEGMGIIQKMAESKAREVNAANPPAAAATPTQTPSPMATKEMDEDVLRRRRGRAANVLAGELTKSAMTGSKTLLGG